MLQGCVLGNVHLQNEIRKVRKVAKAMSDEYSGFLPFATQCPQSTENFCVIPESVFGTFLAGSTTYHIQLLGPMMQKVRLPRLA